MAPKKNTKAPLKKAGTMTATAAAGKEYLKNAWGTAKFNKINAYLDARDTSDTSTDDEAPVASSTAASAKNTTTTTKAKPKLSKARTMKTTAKEAKQLLGKQALGDTRAETKRRQAAVAAKKVLQEVTKPTTTRKATVKRLGTMANTAKEGKAYIKRTAATKKTTGRQRTGGRTKTNKK